MFPAVLPPIARTQGRGKHDYWGVMGAGVLASGIINYGDKPKSILLAGLGLGAFGVVIEWYMEPAEHKA